MEHFAPLSAAIGGILIGLSVGLLWLANGRVAGISGILGGLVPAPANELGWRLAFLVGLPIGGLAGFWLSTRLFGAPALGLPSIEGGLGVALAGGLLVGIGTRLAGGCTSGHGICGLARLSPRSAVAVGTFMASAAAVVFVTRHVL
jgi:uncharacterized membrane protein YedE/YeeE